MCQSRGKWTISVDSMRSPAHWSRERACVFACAGYTKTGGERAAEQARSVRMDSRAAISPPAWSRAVSEEGPCGVRPRQRRGPCVIHAFVPGDYRDEHDRVKRRTNKQNSEFERRYRHTRVSVKVRQKQEE